MMACVRAFTQYPTLNAYLAACSSLLRKYGDLQLEVPYCMIRNDFAHIIKLIATWNEIKKASPRTKNFYMRSAALLISSSSYDTVKKLYKWLFTVLLHEGEGYDEETCEPTSCERAKECLKELIAGNDQIFQNDDLQTVSSQCDPNDPGSLDSPDDPDEIYDEEVTPSQIERTSIFDDINDISTYYVKKKVT